MPVPAGFPPDVFDGDVIEAVHINRVRDSVYLWPGDVLGGGHSLTDVAGVVLRANGAINPLLVYNAAAALDWIIDTNGNLGSGTARNISGVGSVGFSDASVQTTAYKGVAANQTPWLQDIDANGHSLVNVSAIAANAYYGGEFYIGGQKVLNASQAFVGSGVATAGFVIGGAYFIDNLAPKGVIDNGGTFVGPGGVFTAGAVIAKSPGEVWVMNTAGNAILARINGGGLVAGSGFAIEGGASGVSGTFTSANGKTITVTGGIITGIV